MAANEKRQFVINKDGLLLARNRALNLYHLDYTVHSMQYETRVYIFESITAAISMNVY